MSAMAGTPMRHLFLSALLWLPAMFFIWVYWSSVFMLPSSLAAQSVLRGQPALFADVWRGFPRHLIDAGESLAAGPGAPTEGRTARDDHLLVLRFAEAAMPEAMRAEKRATGEEPLPVVNTMKYGYGLALIWGLVMATPLTARRRLAQMLAGWLAISLVQAFGAVTGAWVLALQFLGRDALEAAGLGAEPVALAYQLGYLILPAVVPVVLWTLMNRRLVEDLARPAAAEPAAPAPVPAPPDPAVPGPGATRNEPDGRG